MDSSQTDLDAAFYSSLKVQVADPNSVPNVPKRIKIKRHGLMRLENMLCLVVLLLLALIALVIFHIVDTKVRNTHETRKQTETTPEGSKQTLTTLTSSEQPIKTPESSKQLLTTPESSAQLIHTPLSSEQPITTPETSEMSITTPDSAKKTKTTSATKVKEYCLTKGCIHAASRIDQYIDHTIKPCDDFYKYACGTWLKENVIPEDRSALTAFQILRDQIALKLKALFEEPIRHEEISTIKKVKTFYASCVDKDTIQKRGDSPLKTLLITELGGWPLTHAEWNESQFEFVTTWSKLNILGSGSVLFFYVSIDNKNSSRGAIKIDQPLFGMPGQKYYLVNRNDTLLVAYENLILSVGSLLGLADPDTSEEDVRAMVDFEIQLANISVSDEVRRDIHLLYNPMTLEEVQNNYSEIFNWTKLAVSIISSPEIGGDITKNEIIINQSPPFFQRLIPLLKNTRKRTISNYLIWRFVLSMLRSGALGELYESVSKPYHQLLYGMTNQKDHFRKCVDFVTNSFTIVVSRMFVKDNFDPESKLKALDMIAELKKALNELLENLDWMDETTKQYAEEKNKLISTKIGYPDEVHNDTFIDYLFFNVTFNKDTYFENILNYNRFSFYENIRGLWEPVNKDTWNKAASDVNAFYSETRNQIMFPAGIFQPPFYSKAFPMSLNYGGIGVVIGHEITHGFDDRGRMYDKYGNLFRWMSNDAETKFKAKAQCIIDQYGNFTLEQIKMKLNGINTQGENIADNGGLKQAFRAYRNWVKSRGSEEAELPGLNFTNNQLFFINFAQLWCSLSTDADALIRVRVRQHSPGIFRVIGSVQNSKDFAEAFDCPVGSNMNPSTKCEVW